MSRPVVLMIHPSTELYGSDRVFLESVRALVTEGWCVLVAVGQDGPLTRELRSSGARVLRCRTPVLRKAALRPGGFLRLAAESVLAVGPMLRTLLGHRITAVYVNTLTIPMWPVLARLVGKPVLTHVHEAEEAVPAPVRTALAVPLLAATKVLVNSAATGSALLRSLPALRGRIRLVYNGVPGPAEAVRPPVQAHDPVRIVLVGRLSPRKGTDVAVRAVARLCRDGRQVTLELVGSVFTGYEWYERQLRELVREHGLQDRVCLRGFDADVWSAYADADIAIVPSRFEPFGNTSVEAQLAGVPVVVSDVQGLPETVGNGSRGLVVAPDDPGALARAVESLLRDWPSALRTARLARTDAQARFDPRRYRRSIASITAGVASRHGHH